MCKKLKTASNISMSDNIFQFAFYLKNKSYDYS